jgi:hypothetical protein
MWKVDRNLGKSGGNWDSRKYLRSFSAALGHVYVKSPPDLMTISSPSISVNICCFQSCPFNCILFLQWLTEIWLNQLVGLWSEHIGWNILLRFKSRPIKILTVLHRLHSSGSSFSSCAGSHFRSSLILKDSFHRPTKSLSPGAGGLHSMRNVSLHARSGYLGKSRKVPCLP